MADAKPPAPAVDDVLDRKSSDAASGTGERGLPAYQEELPDDPDAGLSEEERAALDRKLLWKLDMRLIPWLCLLYLVSFLDRTNIGNAKLAGLPEDLHLSADGSQYNISLTLFFIPYALFEPLTNVMLKRYRPSIFIPTTMVLWGITMTLMGTAFNFSSLAAARWFLGVFEAGLFPGISYYLSCWYKRSEFGLRQAIFFSAAAFAGSFGGLLAFAIEKMNGIGGKGGWAWIFILEGILTTLISLASYFMVYDFPSEAKFLSPEDRARVIRRLKADKQASAEHESFQMEYFWQALKDVKTWLLCLIYMGTDGSLYAFSLFLPTIIKSLGTYNTVQAQLLTVPPYFAAALMTVGVGFIADRTRQRGLCNMVCGLIGVVGFVMLLSARSPAVSYAGTFLGACGIYPTIANTIAWGGNNIEGVYKRGVVMGLFIGWGNLNGVVSSNIFLPRDAPRYIPGYSVIIGYLAVGLFGGSVLLYVYLRHENSLRRAGKRDSWIEGKSAEEVDKMGDHRPDFLYML